MDADFTLLTGEISQDHSLPFYKFVAAFFNTLPAPVYRIPGNHNDGPMVKSIFKNYVNLPELGHLSTPRDFIGLTRVYKIFKFDPDVSASLTIF